MRRAPLVIGANPADDVTSAGTDCACVSEPNNVFSFIRTVPPRDQSLVEMWKCQAHNGRREPALLRTRGDPRPVGSTPYTQLKEPARAPRAAADRNVDLQK